MATEAILETAEIEDRKIPTPPLERRVSEETTAKRDPSPKSQRPSPRTSEKQFEAKISPLSVKDVRNEDDIALLAISVGMEYHEGEKLSAMVDAIIAAEYKKCCVLVGDTLQQHTLRMNDLKLEKPQAITKARNNGDDWLERNKASLEKLKNAGIEVEIIRWDDAFSKVDFITQKTHVDALFAKKNGYTGHVITARGHFVMGKLRATRQDETSLLEHSNEEEHLRSLSAEYILEETAVIRMFAYNAEGKTYNFLYPIKGNEVSESVIKALKYTLDGESNLSFFDLKISELKQQISHKKSNPNSRRKGSSDESHVVPKPAQVTSQAELAAKFGIHSSQPIPQIPTSTSFKEQQLQQMILMARHILNGPQEVSKDLRMGLADQILYSALCQQPSANQTFPHLQ